MKLPSLPRALPLLAAVFALPAAAAPTLYEMQLITNSGMGGGNVSRGMHLQLTHPGNLPNDYQAAHTVPEGMRIGPQLPLVGERHSSGQGSDENPEGRVLIYWGCSATVGKGQPEVIDFRTMAGKVPPEMMAMARQSRSGGKSSAGASLPPRAISWPNARDSSYRGIPENASAVGAHLVKGNFMSRDIDFTLTPALDFLEPMNLKARSTNLRATIPLEWSALTRARGYDLQATGAVNDREMIIWLAARNKSPMLPASQRECTVPEGIFAKTEGAMLSGTAHGPVQGFSYPPQKPGEKKPLIWSATVRVSAHDAILLGMEQPTAAAGQESAQPSVQESVVDSVVPGAGQLLKGLFGR
jgi:hypothetical protein